MPSCGMLRRVSLVGTDVSEERSASIIMVTRIGELGTLAANDVRRFLQEEHGVTSQKTAFFNPASYPVVSGASFPGTNRPRREADH
jgi:hypothetical protein